MGKVVASYRSCNRHTSFAFYPQLKYHPFQHVSLNSCLCNFVNTPLLVIGVYHPFWNDTFRNDRCIDCIAEIIDYVMTTTAFDPSKIRLVVCGDFNGLQQHFGEISDVTHLAPIVTTPTRGANVLDQIFVNYRRERAPRILPPIGKSDHRTVFWDVSPRSLKSYVKKLATRKLSAARKNRFYGMVESVNWMNFIRSASDLDACASMFTDYL